MAKKKDLKKQIHSVVNNFECEIIILLASMPGIDLGKSSSLLMQLEDIRNEFILRVSACGDKQPKLVKYYYQKLLLDFFKSIEDIVKQIQILIGDKA